MLQQCLWIFGLVVYKMQSFFSIKSTSAEWDMSNGEKVQGDTKKTVITKNWITSKILFRLTQNSSYIRSSLCSRHLQSFTSVLQKLFVSLALKKMCSKWAPRRCRHIWIRRAKFSMTLPHSCLGIALIAALIAAFRSGLLSYTLSLRYPHR